MAKSNWVTITELKEKLGLKSTMIVCNWISRGRIKAKSIYGIRLVDSNSIKMGKRGRPKQQGISS